jgi:hypothetical protein
MRLIVLIDGADPIRARLGDAIGHIVPGEHSVVVVRDAVSAYNGPAPAWDA